jgi:hypothetical protein
MHIFFFFFFTFDYQNILSDVFKIKIWKHALFKMEKLTIHYLFVIKNTSYNATFGVAVIVQNQTVTPLIIISYTFQTTLLVGVFFSCFGTATQCHK